MDVFWIFGSGILGLLIGSFLNVLIYRQDTGKNLWGRSMCMSCGRTLSWYDLIPIFSFLIYRARCRTCKTSISWQYPIVELITGIAFAWVTWGLLEAIPLTIFTSNPWITILYYVLLYTLAYTLISLAIAIAVYDIHHKIIPDIWSYSSAITALALAFLLPIAKGETVSILQTLLAGPLIAMPFALIWLVSKGRWMGLGDAKLSLSIGWLLGPYLGLSALIYGIWLGALVGIGLLVAKRSRVTMKTEIPFGPYLIIGAIFALITGFDVLYLETWINVLTLVL